MFHRVQPSGAVGWLFQTMVEVVTITVLLCLAAGIVVLIKVQPHLERSRQVAYDTLAQMERDDFSMLSDTEIFDKNGVRIGLINAGHYEYVDIAHISLNLQNAYIAQEDRRFKTHNGVDWIATTRAGLALIKHRGAITQGEHYHSAGHQKHLSDPGTDLYQEDGGDPSGS